MEGGDNVETDGGSFGAPVTSRWNPTKEQINILENFYKQGVRTPSAEQIQQITTRLKVYGHIEGKNVFYWFQNHKARQRQKQKQESMAYFNHFIHRNHPPQPVFAPQYPCPNVVCSPYYIRNDVGFFPQYHNSKVLQAGGGIVRRRSKSDGVEKPRKCNGGLLGYDSEEYCDNPSCENEATAINTVCKKKTLSLFPTHPTGDLQGGRPTATASASFGPADSSRFSSSVIEGDYDCQTYFDFFCRPQGS